MEKRAETYRNYIADQMYYTAQNKYMDMKYSDIVDPKPKEKTKTAEEIVTDLVTNIGLKFKE